MVEAVEDTLLREKKAAKAKETQWEEERKSIEQERERMEKERARREKELENERERVKELS